MSNSVHNVGKKSSLVVIDLETGAMTTLAHGIVQGASFAPEGSDRLAYALASSELLTAPVNIYITTPDGSGASLLTHDGRSLNPVWGAEGIAYDRERLRPQAAPVYQIGSRHRAAGPRVSSRT